MSNISKYILLVVFCLFLSTPAGAAELTVNKIAAVVNGEMITLHELRSQTMAELVRQNIPQDDARVPAAMQSVLDAMISDILIRQEATRYKITISDAEVNTELGKILQARKLSQAAFDEQLKKQGSTPELFKESMRNNLLRQRMISLMIARKVVVTEAEVAKYYEDNKERFTGQRSVDFSVIIFGPSIKAEGIAKQISSGTLSFEDAAQRYSQDSSAKKGGHIGTLPLKRLPGDFRNLLSSLREGQVSPVISIEGKQALVRLNKVTEGSPQTLEEAAPQITGMLHDMRMQERFQEYTQQLRGKAVVDIRL